MLAKRATINPRRGTRPNDDDERNPTKGNESNLLNIACSKVNDTNTGTIAVPDLRWLPVNERYAMPTYYITVYSLIDLSPEKIIIERFELKLNMLIN